MSINSEVYYYTVVTDATVQRVLLSLCVTLFALILLRPPGKIINQYRLENIRLNVCEIPLSNIFFTVQSLSHVSFASVIFMQMMRSTCNTAPQRAKREALVGERLRPNAKASSPKWGRSSSPGNGERKSRVISSPKRR